MGKEFLNDLNKEQYEAATTLDGYLLVIAGAGTGKTKTLVSRVANLLSEGIDPENVLLLTFTKKAAKEMQDRVCAFPSIDNGEKIAAQTFHSFCSDVLRRYASFVGLSNDFELVNAEYAEDMIGMFAEEVRRKYKEAGQKAQGFPSNGRILEISGKAVSYLLPEETICYNDEESAVDPAYVEDVLEILKKYKEYKKSHSMLDFDDLLLYTYKLLTENENIRAKLDRKYKYIMCDEYQDTNLIQDKLLDLLSRDYPNLCVVGDDNQSIYKFRGARIENILTFCERHGNCPEIKLIQNYRSTQEILDYANAVMSHAQEGIPKRLVGFSSGEPVQVCLAQNDFDLARWIVDDIYNKIQDGIDPQDICVMGRHGETTQIVETQLQRAQIPFQKFGGKSFFAQAVIRDMLAFLRAGAYIADEISWFRVLNLIPGVGEKKARNIYAKIAELGPEYLASEEMQTDKAAVWFSYLHEYLTEVTSEPPVDQIAFVADFYQQMRETSIDGMKTTENKRNEQYDRLYRNMQTIETLKYLAIEYSSVRDMLEDFALNVPAQNDSESKVNVTTIHSAKGLEYDTVYLVNPVEGVFPRKQYDCDDQREDLRCMYVALTRAKQHLYICIAEDVVLYGRHIEAYLSEFLAYRDVLAMCDYPSYLEEMLPFLQM